MSKAVALLGTYAALSHDTADGDAGLRADGSPSFPFVVCNADNKRIGLLALVASAEDEVTTQLIRSDNRGRGHGRAMMDELCARADAHGVRLSLTVSDLYVDEPGALTKEQLTDWYISKEFVSRAEGAEMVRQPQSCSAGPSAPTAVPSLHGR